MPRRVFEYGNTSVRGGVSGDLRLSISVRMGNLSLIPTLSLSFALLLAAAFALIAGLVLVALRRRRDRAQLQTLEIPAAIDASPARKIVIFFSSIGYGHISAAQAIQNQIIQHDSEARVILQDIREFMHPLWRRIDERLYWLVAGNLPETFDVLFRNIQARGNNIPSLARLPNGYPEEKVRAFLERLAPDAILATHYGSAQVLGNLRERGLLTNVRIGWLHTDYFEGYFPRISKRIDRTFLAHPVLEARWLAAGVPPEKITTSGMPVAIAAEDLADRDATLAGLGLSPDKPTVLLTSGKEGVGDYTGAIDSLARRHEGPLQIIAVCGTNDRQRAQLEMQRHRLPNTVSLKVLGLVSHADLLSWMHVADVLITKAGGMTPAEAFTLGTPTILLDVVGGHERVNAALFVQLGVAELAVDAEQAGELAQALLMNRDRMEAMRGSQREFLEHANIASIALFALDDAYTPRRLPPDFGVENGEPVLNTDEALAQLDTKASAEVELLLSDATAQSPQRIVFENPFGHLAIRIDDIVYSANYVADPSIDPNFLQHVSLADYLYGVRRSSPSQVHTNTYGMAYGRETLGLRVAGIREERRKAMIAAAHRIEDEFMRGALRWDKSDFNCADVVERILQAGGYAQLTLADRLGLPSMPLDSFERARGRFEEDASLRLDLVAYRLVPGSRASYRFSRFPLSLWHPLRSVARVLDEVPHDPLEAAVTKHLTGYFGDCRLYYEDLDLRSRQPNADVDGTVHFSRLQRQLAGALAADLRHLLATNAKLSLQDIGPVLYGAQEIRRLLDRTLDLARIATEESEYLLDDARARRLRALFMQLMRDHVRIGTWRMQSGKIEVYLERFQAFETTMSHEFSSRLWTRFWRTSPRWRFPKLRASWRRHPGGGGCDK